MNLIVVASHVCFVLPIWNPSTLVRLQGDRGHPRQVGHAWSFGMHLPRAVGTERCLLPGASLVQGWCPDLRQGR